MSLLASSIGITAVPALASHGKGYDGPTLNAVTIPLGYERGIEVSKVEQAIATCLIEGDPKRGLVAAMAPIFSAATGVPVQYVRGSSWAETPIYAEYINSDASHKVIAYDVHRTISTKGDRFIGNGTLYDSREIELNPSKKSFQQSLLSWREPWGSTLATDLKSYGEVNELGLLVFSSGKGSSLFTSKSVRIPTVSYGQRIPTMREPYVDPSYGTKQYYSPQSKDLLRNVNIEIPKGYENSIPLGQWTTNHGAKRLLGEVGFIPSGVTFDVQSYVACLKSEIQRNAGE